MYTVALRHRCRRSAIHLVVAHPPVPGFAWSSASFTGGVDGQHSYRQWLILVTSVRRAFVTQKGFSNSFLDKSRQTHLPRTTFSHAQLLHRLAFTCCQSAQSHIDLHAPAWLKSRSTLSAFRPKTFTLRPRRAVSYSLQNMTPRTGTRSPPFSESVFQQPGQPCEETAPAE